MEQGTGLNLLNDRWIPVRLKDGASRVIAPWEMIDPAIAAPDWPRADLDLACYELLIGLILMAAPPEDLNAWRAGLTAEALRDALSPFAPAFNLTGDGPRFLQELGGLEGEAIPADKLFIDSAGASSARKNADLMVRQGRYAALQPTLAAMTLYTLQAFAPAGGAGIRTSMRGGGPMVTLVDPGEGLWPLVWANVPYGIPASPEDLPWMRPTRLSDGKGDTQTYPEHGHKVEAFFGMPRRLWLMQDEDGAITGAIQKPSGTNYAGWQHPLSPYYRVKEGAELLPVHPKPGGFGYRNWLGVVANVRDAKDEKRRAQAVETWQERARLRRGPKSTLIVAGWAMKNATPRSFLHSVQPLLDLPNGRERPVEQMISVADKVAQVLRGAMGAVIASGEARDAVREEFFVRTEPGFLARIGDLAKERLPEDFAETYIADLRRTALALFDARAVPTIDARSSKQQAEIVRARRNLLALGPKKFPDFVSTVGQLQQEEPA
ncbi:type I-E CRISPR-associated protein Cse1/CasA [Marivita sp. GX14005]|uniref:type I-E CRISPR-associated protein Cse1/CasA n=1 Tax=Marivita sp. GX14005 TaxID=2942276 RepID=UPI0020185A57|nr:type I-E CRISPR-associated protein Cse1/CasA [Marivita sp. GX14005]MCL3883010.1 type I-E CRISPR-associated protein Cse1/CasA [Marivita sp. GX14005]